MRPAWGNTKYILCGGCEAKGTYGKPAKSKESIIKVYHKQHVVTFLTSFFYVHVTAS